jgi:hypothetical protein
MAELNEELKQQAVIAKSEMNDCRKHIVMQL